MPNLVALLLGRWPVAGVGRGEGGLHMPEAPGRLMFFVGSEIAGRGGRETVIPTVVQGLRSRGHVVSMVLLGHAADRRWEDHLPGLRVGPVQPGPNIIKRHFLLIASWLRKTISELRPQVVIAVDPEAAFLVRMTMIRPPRLVSWLHGDYGLYRHSFGLAFCQAHLAVSHALAERAVKDFHKPALAVGNPVDLAVPVLRRPAADDVARFLYIGRLDGNKRVDRILGALGRVHLPWRLQVVGDGPERGNLEALAATLGIGDRVDWYGWCEDPWMAVAEVTALLLTSHSEGFPMVLLEAAARGVPIMAMDCPTGPGEIVTPENGWLLAESDDLTEMSTLLTELCLGQCALPSAEQIRATAARYSLDAVLRRMEEGLALARERGQHAGHVRMSDGLGGRNRACTRR